MSTPEKQPEQTEKKEMFLDAITKTIHDYGEVIKAECKAEIDAMRPTMLKMKQDILNEMLVQLEEVKKEGVKAVRSGLGLEQPVVYTKDDMVKFVREILLEEAGDKKRSETVIKDKPDEGTEEGNYKFDDIEKDFEKMKKDRGI